MPNCFGLIFDVDGVIADTEKVNANASIKVFADVLGIKGVKREDFEKGLGRGAEAYIRAAATVHGVDLTKEQADTATKARQDEFLRMLKEEPLPPFPGVLELMNAALARADFRLAIATSSTREKSEAVLRSARIPYERAFYITGDKVKRKKPDPELFQLAAAGIGVATARCVVIEDAPDGVEAARAAGCKCVAVTNSTTAGKLAAAGRVVSSLSEISIEDVLGMASGG